MTILIVRMSISFLVTEFLLLVIHFWWRAINSFKTKLASNDRECTYLLMIVHLIIKLGKMAVIYKYRMHYWIAVHPEHNTAFTALFEHKLLVNIRKSTYQRRI